MSERIKRLLTKAENAHRKAIELLGKYHRYPVGTSAADKAFDAYTKQSDAFNAAMSEIRVALVQPKEPQ